MPPRILKDPELRIFAERYQHTIVGRHYRTAWNDSEMAIRQIRILSAINLGQEKEINAWRRKYIESQNQADDALIKLETLYRWPY